MVAHHNHTCNRITMARIHRHRRISAPLMNTTRTRHGQRIPFVVIQSVNSVRQKVVKGICVVQSLVWYSSGFRHLLFSAAIFRLYIYMLCSPMPFLEHTRFYTDFSSLFKLEPKTELFNKAQSSNSQPFYKSSGVEKFHFDVCFLVSGA